MTRPSFHLPISDVFPFKDVPAVVLGTVEQDEIAVGNTALVTLG